MPRGRRSAARPPLLPLACPAWASSPCSLARAAVVWSSPARRASSTSACAMPTTPYVSGRNSLRMNEKSAQNRAQSQSQASPLGWVGGWRHETHLQLVPGQPELCHVVLRHGQQLLALRQLRPCFLLSSRRCGLRCGQRRLQRDNLGLAFPHLPHEIHSDASQSCTTVLAHPMRVHASRQTHKPTPPGR
jgi:hypothetical protein